MTDSLTAAIATTVHAARTKRGLSVAALAQASGVSRAMITKVERGAAAPTAVLLGRLSGALGVSLSELLARAEASVSSVSRAADRPAWIDPGTGLVRHTVSPTPGGPLELVEVELPPGAEVAYPAESYAFSHHQIWVLEGALTFQEGNVEHDLATGDCLQLGPPQPCTYRNLSSAPSRYLVALARR